MKFLSYSALHHDNLLIYLPGMDGSGAFLQYQDNLKEYFEIRTFYVGNEIIKDWESLITQFIEIFKQTIKREKYQKIYLLAESFGGCLALKLIAEYPDLFDTVILINSASSFYRRNWLNIGSYVAKIMPQLIYSGATYLLLPFLVNLDVIELSQRFFIVDILQTIAPQTVANRINLLNEFSLDIDKISKFSAPVLIIASAQDNLLPSVEEGYRLKEIFPNSFLSIFNNSGHCCLVEKQVNLLETFKQFLLNFSNS
ncbi:MAG: alpha/beta hydrolase [Cyanobacterium sp. T60_A2020_053]|nr:alpha/beta hydrolase [Cyanobacterium sp. T60_A2020_053]